MKKPPVINGLIAGIITIAWLLLWYNIDKKMMTQAWMSGSIWAIYIAAMIKTTRDAGKQTQEFRTILRWTFATFLVVNLLYYAFDFVMLRWVDPELIVFRKEAAVQWYEWLGVAETRPDVMQQIRDADFTPGVGNFIFNYFRGAIGGFIVSVIFVFIYKRLP